MTANQTESISATSRSRSFEGKLRTTEPFFACLQVQSRTVRKGRMAACFSKGPSESIFSVCLPCSKPDLQHLRSKPWWRQRRLAVTRSIVATNDCELPVEVALLVVLLHEQHVSPGRLGRMQRDVCALDTMRWPRSTLVASQDVAPSALRHGKYGSPRLQEFCNPGQKWSSTSIFHPSDSKLSMLTRHGPILCRCKIASYRSQSRRANPLPSWFPLRQKLLPRAGFSPWIFSVIVGCTLGLRPRRTTVTIRDCKSFRSLSSFLWWHWLLYVAFDLLSAQFISQLSERDK